MDTRYLAGNLIAMNEIEEGRCRLSTGAGEEVYYKRHTPKPADGRVLRIASAIAAVWFGFGAIGFWLQ